MGLLFIIKNENFLTLNFSDNILLLFHIGKFAGPQKKWCLQKITLNVKIAVIIMRVVAHLSYMIIVPHIADTLQIKGYIH